MPKRLNKKEKGAFRHIGEETLELRGDQRRRLRNALLCLAQSDNHWMIWVENNIPHDLNLSPELLLLIEARARAVVLKPYRFLGREIIGHLLFAHNWPFSDDGNLTAG